MKEFLHILAAENRKNWFKKSSIIMLVIFLAAYLAISVIFLAADDETSDEIMSRMSGYPMYFAFYTQDKYSDLCDINRIASQKHDVEIARQRVGNLDEDNSLIEKYNTRSEYNVEKRALAVMQYEIDNGIESSDMTKAAIFSQLSLSVFSKIAVVGTIIVAAAAISSNTAAALARPAKRWKLLTCKFISVLLYGLFMYALGLIFTFLLGGLLFGFDGFDYVFVEALGTETAFAASAIPFTLIKAALSFSQVILFISIVFLTYCLFNSPVLAAGMPLLLYFASGFIAQITALLDIYSSKYLIFFNLDLSSFLSVGPSSHPQLTIGVSAIVMAVHFVVFMALSYILYIKRNLTASGSFGGSSAAAAENEAAQTQSAI